LLDGGAANGNLLKGGRLVFITYVRGRSKLEADR